MKRVVIGALVVGLLIGAAWTASSYWFGMQTESRYRSMIEESSSWGQARMVNESYERGIFRSQAKTVVEIGQPPPKGKALEEQPVGGPLRFTLMEEILHGPLPFMAQAPGQSLLEPALAVIETRVAFDPEKNEVLKQLQDLIPKDAVTKFTTVLHWKGEGETRVSMKPFRQESGQDEKVGVDFGGLDAQIRFSLDLKRFSGNLLCEKLRVQTARHGLYQMGQMDGTFDQYQGANGLFLGDIDFKLNHFEFQGPQGGGKAEEPFRVKGLQVKTSARESANDLSTSAVTSMDQLGLGEFGADKALLEVEFRKLDARAVSELQSTLRGLRNLQDSQEEMSRQALEKAVDLLARLLRNSPEMAIKRFGFMTPEGELQAAAKLMVDGTQVGDSLNIASIVNASDLEAKVDVSEKLLVRILKSGGRKSEGGTDEDSKAEAVPDSSKEDVHDAEIQEQLAGLLAQGYLKLENGTYKTSARYAKGKLTVNQRDVPLNQFLGH